MMRKLFICGLLTSSLINSQIYAAEQIKWPIPDWETFDNSERLSSKECINFKNFAVKRDDFKTDGLIVIKDGMLHFEHYDSKYNLNSPHAMWSVSKTITGALLGISENEGRVRVTDLLSQYYPRELHDPNYEKITLNNLLYMDAGYIWEEDAQDVKTNPVIKMLYGTGHSDMANFVASRKMIKEGPDYQWKYSSGIPTATMGVLKKIYGKEDADMPWRLLFNPLGMYSTVFERDLSGTFIGGTSVFSTPRDLAKLGYLYLNDGIWNHEVLLPPEWIKKMLTPSPGYLSPGTVIKDIEKDGVYGGSIWLNVETNKISGKPFPNAPADTYMAIGFMGQLLIMIPSLKMIIVRTGYDTEFRSKLNEFISRAIQCLHDPNHKIGTSSPSKNPINMSLPKLIRNIKNSIDANTLQASIAKTVCSCHFVTGQEISTCLKRNNFTLSKLLTKITVTEEDESGGHKSIQVRLARFARLFKHQMGKPAKAFYNPQTPKFGCTLK